LTLGVEVTVAVIDSGVHRSHPHVQHIAGGIGIDDHGRTHDDFIDRLGHGTAVAAVIREKAPAADILAVKIFDRALSATGDALVAALAWARHAGVNVINLSLGTTNAALESQLSREVAAARQAGIVIVAAAPQPDKRWLPGALPGVVRVTLDMAIARETCHATLDSDGEMTVAASGYPRPIPGVAPENNLNGLSFAVANVTGLVARAWPEWQSALLLQSDRSPSTPYQ
jgi:subtilisin family serine protease